MASAHDVAAHILGQQGSMSTWKLQKLVYYSQAWHLAWDELPLFDETIEAWANGPVVRALYAKHRGSYSVGNWNAGDADSLTQDEKDTIDAVLATYGKLTGRQLSDLTHAEPPWIEAREGLDPTDRSTRPISLDTMQEFYTWLNEDNDATPVDQLRW